MKRKVNLVANIKSAKKRILTNEKSALRNKSIKSDLKTAIKKADLAISENANDKNNIVKAAVKKLDMAASKGVLHKNTVARKKSHLMSKAN